MAGEWIIRLAADERRRDGVRLHESEAAARRIDLVRAHGRRLIDDLRTAVSRDIETFRQEFPKDEVREILFQAVPSDGGFVVNKPKYPAACLTVGASLLAASVSCQYQFTSTNGLPPREDRLNVMFTTGGDDDTLQMKLQSTGQVFTSADALSEYLLAPVFTGRPR